jgi:hypothetical protein
MKKLANEESAYEGFLMDLLEELSRDVGFQYVIEESSKYGSFDPESGNWSGVIGKLVNKVSFCQTESILIKPIFDAN